MAAVTALLTATHPPLGSGEEVNGTSSRFVHTVPMSATNKTDKDDADWEAILRSPWASIYINELFWLARDSYTLCDGVFEEAKAPAEGGNYIKVDHSLHRDLYSILNNCARITAMIKERPRRSGQAAGAYAVQGRRTQWLSAILSGVRIEEVRHVKVRHSLEHFDEFLDQTALKSRRGQIAQPALFPVDMTFGRDGLIDPDTNNYPLRVYLAQERVFVNCGQRISIGKIQEECMAIANQLQSAAPDILGHTVDASEERGSSMLVITPESFNVK